MPAPFHRGRRRNGLVPKKPQPQLAARNPQISSANLRQAPLACDARTKGQPIEGASACNLANSAAYSGGTRSGIVPNICATFISGPLRPPKCGACNFRTFLPPFGIIRARRSDHMRRCPSGQRRRLWRIAPRACAKSCGFQIASYPPEVRIWELR